MTPESELVLRLTHLSLDLADEAAACLEEGDGDRDARLGPLWQKGAADVELAAKTIERLEAQVKRRDELIRANCETAARIRRNYAKHIPPNEWESFVDNVQDASVSARSMYEQEHRATQQVNE